jgi:hypothetical protein
VIAVLVLMARLRMGLLVGRFHVRRRGPCLWRTLHGRPGFRSRRHLGRALASGGAGLRMLVHRLRLHPRFLRPGRFRMVLRRHGMQLRLLTGLGRFTLLPMLAGGDVFLRHIGLLMLDIGDRLLPRGSFLLRGRLMTSAIGFRR